MRIHLSPSAFRAMLVCMLTVPAAALATVTSSIQIQTPTAFTNYSSALPDSHVLTVGGGQGTVQFTNTSGCVGLACGVNGPAVGAYLSSGDAVVQDINATVQYTFNVVGDPGLVPILLLGQYAVIDPFELPARSGGTLATSVVQIRGSQSQRLYNFQSLCYNYDPATNEQAPASNCGTGVFQGSFMATAGTSVSVQLSVTVLRLVDNDGLVDDGLPAASAYLDPFFQIDPAFAAAHPGYSLAFDSGVGNAMPGIDTVSPVPEPETLVLLAGGFVALVAKRRRGTA